VPLHCRCNGSLGTYQPVLICVPVVCLYMYPPSLCVLTCSCMSGARDSIWLVVFLLFSNKAHTAMSCSMYEQWRAKLFSISDTQSRTYQPEAGPCKSTRMLLVRNAKFHPVVDVAPTACCASVQVFMRLPMYEYITYVVILSDHCNAHWCAAVCC
jgi:hypothetical protein